MPAGAVGDVPLGTRLIARVKTASFTILSFTIVVKTGSYLTTLPLLRNWAEVTDGYARPMRLEVTPIDPSQAAAVTIAISCLGTVRPPSCRPTKPISPINVSFLGK